MDLRLYLKRAGLPAVSEFDGARAGGFALAALHAGEKLARSKHETAQAESLWSYPVPELSPDGACSLGDRLSGLPFSLQSRLGPATVELTKVLLRIKAALDNLNRRIAADWLGVYLRVEAKPTPVLVKLAYLGAPSRAEFPMSEDFAERSNNVRVALFGKAVVIPDVDAHRAAGGAFYVCDARVGSEVCLPVPSRSTGPLGIVDAESFNKGHFGPDRVCMLAAFALQLAPIFRRLRQRARLV
jgi:putative methionine-R-sulfoxide reductase with GAF domain